MIILGIDPALSISGYGAIDFSANHIGLIEAGIISTNASESLAERLNKIYRAIIKLIDDINPQVVVVEKIYAHYAHPTTAYILGHARGVIFLACAVKKIKLVEYAATRVKKSVVGKGLASKYQVQRMVTQTLGLDKIPEYTDVTDAIALALTHGYITKHKV